MSLKPGNANLLSDKGFLLLDRVSVYDTAGLWTCDAPGLMLELQAYTIGRIWR